MKLVLFCVAVFVCLSTNAHAAITCWYGPGGSSTGADDADPRYPANQVSSAGGPGVSSDYAWAYTVDGPPSECPKTLPESFNAAKTSSTTGLYLYTGPLTAVSGTLQLHSAHLAGYVVVVPCSGVKIDQAALTKLAGTSVTVTGRYTIAPKGGKFCATGFLSAQP